MMNRGKGIYQSGAPIRNKEICKNPLPTNCLSRLKKVAGKFLIIKYIFIHQNQKHISVTHVEKYNIKQTPYKIKSKSYF